MKGYFNQIHFMKIGILLIFMTLCVSPGYAQSMTDSLQIYFKQGSSALDLEFESNGDRIRRFIDHIENTRSNSFAIVNVHYVAGASPEGTVSGNRRLAQRRASTVTDYLRRTYNIPDSVVTLDVLGEDYTTLIRLVDGSDMPYRDEVLKVLRSAHSEAIGSGTLKNELRSMYNGVPWQYMYTHFFPKLRQLNIYIKVEGVNVPEPEPAKQDTVSVVVSDLVPLEPALVPEEPVSELEAEPVLESPRRHFYLKTNAVGWGLLMANVAVEADLAPHWSFTLPVYYSALNYFTSTVKFRTTCIQPEIRYWFSEDNQGWFGGAHFGLAWFNYAKGGDYRYQDHNRRTPLYGGGLNAGYRMPISQNNRWWLEFSLGGGVYKLHYDIFHNEPNGQLIDTRKRTFYVIDNVAVSFAYRFDLKKKGGRK